MKPRVIVVAFGVAWLTERHAVAHLVTKVGMLCERLDVVGCEVSTMTAAPLTGVVITLENSSTPVLELCRLVATLEVAALATLPVMGVRPGLLFGFLASGFC